MELFYDINNRSLNKNCEELCGDNIYIDKNDNGIIVVLADGLGSGVKANILSTLTSKIIGTMLKNGATVDEAVETISNTLPVCSVRNIAYSTFTILKINKENIAYLVEFDNPSVIMLRDGKPYQIEKTVRNINGKNIKESEFEVLENDLFIMISDGVVHAGVGRSINLGWQWENVRDFMTFNYRIRNSSKIVTNMLIDICNDLYENIPGDDTTCITVRARRNKTASLLVGPPINKYDDHYLVKRFAGNDGIKIICGGTTSQIVSRVLNKPITVEADYINENIPPTAKIDGIDLVTEGILTLKKVLEYIKRYNLPSDNLKDFYETEQEDGAAKLAKILLDDATILNFYIGRAINPAHTMDTHNINIKTKLNIVEEISQNLRALGKKVFIEYY